MVALSCLVAAFAIGGPQDNGSILAKLFPNPSGKNGYEDYAMACDVANRDAWSMYDQWLGYLQTRKKGTDPNLDPMAPDIPPKVSPGMTDLEVRKIMDDQFGNAIHWISGGNRKPIVNPHQVLNLETALPELASLKTLAKVDINRAHVEFADGRSAAAVKDLLEGLKFSHNIFGTTRISSLVSIASQAIVLSEFQRNLAQLSLDDAKDIDKGCKTLLEERFPTSEMLRIEYGAATSDLDAILDKPSILFSDEKDQATADLFKNLSSQDRDQIKSLFAEGMGTKLSEETARFDGPESAWLLKDQSADPVYSMNDHTPSNLAAILVDELAGKGLERQFATAMAKSRIQLRLLRLHAQVIEFKWLNNHLPDRLSDCAIDHADFDPIGGESFHYEKTDDGYRLYSQGVPGLGRIELKYRASAAAGAGSGGGGGSNPPPY